MSDLEPAPVTAENLAKLDSDAQQHGNNVTENVKRNGSRSVKSNMSFSQRAMDSVSSTVIQSLVAVNDEPARLSTQKRKAPLSLATTAVNFRGFVQKSGPLFAFQDAVESTLMWDDWPWTTMWMGIWAVVSLHPRLFVCVPSAIALTLMCNTFFIRFPITDADRDMSPSNALRKTLNLPDILQDEPRAAPIEPRPVTEGELKYLMHMRDIQNMMRLIIDGYDHLSPVVKYLNWSDVPRTLRIFQATVVVLVASYFVAPFIPWRLIGFVVGELALIAHHPWLKPTVEAVKKQLEDMPGKYKRAQRQRRLKQYMLDMLNEDRLPEYVWQRGWKDVEVFENQRLRTGRQSNVNELSWSAQNLHTDERKPWTRGSDGYTPDDSVARSDELRVDDIDYQLPDGYEWIEGENWRIDWGGAWSPVGVDDAGYVYTDSSWRQPAPYAYGSDPAAPKSPLHWRRDDDDENDDDGLSLPEELNNNVCAVTRRRRWLRRIVRVCTDRKVSDSA